MMVMMMMACMCRYMLNFHKRPSMVAHICNPSYLGVEDGKDCGSRPAQAEVRRLHLNK
jgi:hypothetical protein